VTFVVMPWRVTMAAVTGPGISSPPPPVFGGRKRRWWLVGLVGAWIVVLAGVAVWSVRHSPATVPEQRDIAEAVPELQRAAGVLFAAADGDGRAVVLGDLELIGDCRITPVRHGFLAARDLTVYVREGEAQATLDRIADALPAGYRAGVVVGRGGTRLALHADAGNFIGIDTSALATAKALTLRLTSGCRPGPESAADRSDPAAAAAPAELGTVLTGLGGSGKPAVRAVACPDGGVAAGYTVGGIATPGDFEQRMRTLSAGAAVVRSDAAVWAYRKGSESVVVVPDDKQLKVSVSTGCQ
jgi:hypothetical protein